MDRLEQKARARVGDEHLAAGRLAEACRAFEVADRRGLLACAAAYVERGEFQFARDASLKAGNELSKGDCLRCGHKGLAAGEAGDDWLLEEAVYAYREAGYGAGLKRCAEVKIERGHLSEARDILAECGHSMTREEIAACGLKYLRKGWIGPAVQAFEMIGETLPAAEAVAFARASYRRGVFDEAIEALRMVGARGELTLCGCHALDLGRPLDAILAFELSEDSSWLFVCGRRLLDCGHYLHAVRLLAKAEVAVSPRDSVRCGYVALDRGLLADAVEAFADGRCFVGLSECGRRAVRAGEVQLAIRAFQLAEPLGVGDA